MIRSMSSVDSSRRFEPSDLRILTHMPVALINWIFPLRSALLRLVSTQI